MPHVASAIQRLAEALVPVARNSGHDLALVEAVDAVWRELLDVVALDALLHGLAEAFVDVVGARTFRLLLMVDEQPCWAVRARAGRGVTLWPSARSAPTAVTTALQQQHLQIAIGDHLVLPLWHKGRIVGAVVCGGLTERAPMLRVLPWLAPPIAAALRQAQLLQQQQATEARLRRIFEQLPAAVWTTDQKLCIRSAMGAGLARVGLQPDAMIGKSPDEIFGATPDPLTRLGRRALAGESVGRRGQRGDRQFETSIEPLRDADGRIVGTLGVALDVTEQRRAEAALAAERASAQATLEAIADGVITTSPEGQVLYLNPAAERLLAIEEQTVLGLPVTQIFRTVNETTGAPFPNPAVEALRTGAPHKAAPGTALVRADGTQLPIEDDAGPITDSSGNTIGTVIVFRDISERRALTADVVHAATHDTLTGLPNRVLFLDRLERAVAHAERHAGKLAVFFLDLDRFKHINDTLGHAIGDRLLQQVAERLRQGVRRTDTISRHGGDEFLILLDEPTGPGEVAELATSLVERIRRPYRVDGCELHVSTSLGISVYPDDGRDAETLVKHADLAMYHAKWQGRNSFQFFLPDMNRRARQRLTLEQELRQALDWQQFTLYYQPQVDLRSGQLVGAEALLRWHHPEHGTVLPDRFISVAEDSGLIVPIGDWVLRECCHQARAWQMADLPTIRVSANVSAAQFANKQLVEVVEAVLRDTGLASEQLELELTESVLMEDSSGGMERLIALKALGVRLAVDDFGTGYSSLSYLKQLPVDQIKIDKGFVRDVPDAADDVAIAKAIIRMAHSLRLKVVAEGVETAAAAHFLRAHRCSYAQGFYFSRPLRADQFELFLRNARH